MKKQGKKLAFVTASFTVESAFVIPLVILSLTLGLHIAYELQDSNIKETKKPPAVEKLEPVEEKYRQWNI